MNEAWAKPARRLGTQEGRQVQSTLKAGFVVFVAQRAGNDAKTPAHGFGQRGAGFVADAFGNPADGEPGLPQVNDSSSETHVFDILGGCQAGQFVEYAMEVEWRKRRLTGQYQSVQRFGQIGGDVLGDRIDPATIREFA